MKNKILTLFMGLFLLSTFSIIGAEENRCGSTNSYLGEFKIYSSVSLWQVCDDCSYVNITAVKYPNGTYESFNLAMTKNNQNFYYSFSNTSQIGCYSYTVAGDKNGVFSTEVIDFQVTPSGFVGTLGFYALILILSLGIIVLGFNREDPTTVILGSFGLYFVGIYILFNGLDGIRDAVFTRAIGIIILMIAAYLSVRSGWEMIED